MPYPEMAVRCPVHARARERPAPDIHILHFTAFTWPRACRRLAGMHPSQAAARHVPPRVVRITARGGLANDRKLPAGHRELPVRVRAPAEHCVALVDRARVELAARKLRTKAAVQPAGRPPRPSCSRAGRGAGAVRHRGGRTPAPSRASSSPSSAHSQCSLPRCRTPRRAPPRRRTPRACAGRCPARRRWSPSTCAAPTRDVSS
jgi:hypothetical protein